MKSNGGSMLIGDWIRTKCIWQYGKVDLNKNGDNARILNDEYFEKRKVLPNSASRISIHIGRRGVKSRRYNRVYNLFQKKG